MERNKSNCSPFRQSQRASNRLLFGGIEFFLEAISKENGFQGEGFGVTYAKSHNSTEYHLQGVLCSGDKTHRHISIVPLSVAIEKLPKDFLLAYIFENAEKDSNIIGVISFENRIWFLCRRKSNQSINVAYYLK